MHRPTLNAEEKRLFDAIAQVDEVRSTKPHAVKRPALRPARWSS